MLPLASTLCSPSRVHSENSELEKTLEQCRSVCETIPVCWSREIQSTRQEHRTYFSTIRKGLGTSARARYARARILLRSLDELGLMIFVLCAYKLLPSVLDGIHDDKLESFITELKEFSIPDTCHTVARQLSAKRKNELPGKTWNPFSLRRMLSLGSQSC